VRIALPSGRDLASLVDRAVRSPAAVPEAHEPFGATVVQRDSS
jgi:hypothetical protein